VLILLWLFGGDLLFSYWKDLGFCAIFVFILTIFWWSEIIRRVYDSPNAGTRVNFVWGFYIFYNYSLSLDIVSLFSAFLLSNYSFAAKGSNNGKLVGIYVQSILSSRKLLKTSSIVSNFLFYLKFLCENEVLHSAHLANFSFVFSLTT